MEAAGPTAADAPQHQLGPDPGRRRHHDRGNLEENYISPQKEALRYDPAAEHLDADGGPAEERGYHSTALLLPDGRIMSAGDDGPSDLGGQSDEIEVFSPPYLFKGPRPQITSAPDAVPYGSACGVGTPDGDVAKAVLVAPGNTHANDMRPRSCRWP